MTNKWANHHKYGNAEINYFKKKRKAGILRTTVMPQSGDLKCAPKYSYLV